jgi:hypothetical protein
MLFVSIFQGFCSYSAAIMINNGGVFMIADKGTGEKIRSVGF